jgi:acid stress-induced BolA-like protein IbaG/YrbA
VKRGDSIHVRGDLSHFAIHIVFLSFLFKTLNV